MKLHETCDRNPSDSSVTLSIMLGTLQVRRGGNSRRRITTLPLVGSNGVFGPLAESEGEDLREPGFCDKRAARLRDQNTATDLLGTKRSIQELGLSHLMRRDKRMRGFPEVMTSENNVRPSFASLRGSLPARDHEEKL